MGQVWGGVFGTGLWFSVEGWCRLWPVRGSVLLPGHACGPGAFVPVALGGVPLECLRWAVLRPPCPLCQMPGPCGLWDPAEEGRVRPCSTSLLHAYLFWGLSFPACRKRVLSEGSPLLPRPEPARPSPPLPQEALCLLCVRVRVSPVLHTLLALGTCSAIYLVGPSLGLLICKMGRVIAPAQRLTLPPSLLTCLPCPTPRILRSGGYLSRSPHFADSSVGVELSMDLSLPVLILEFGTGGGLGGSSGLGVHGGDGAYVCPQPWLVGSLMWEY